MSKICPVLYIATPITVPGERTCIEDKCAWWSPEREWEENGARILKVAQCAVLEQGE